MKNAKQTLRALVFLLVLALVAFNVQGMFGIDNGRAFSFHRNLFKEKKGTLDGVFIGASNVLSFWQPGMAWSSHGIAVLNYAFTSLPMGAVKYLVEEARKSQPDALYIINLNTFKYKQPKARINDIHRTVDYMAPSLNKVRLINAVAEQSGLGFDEKLQLLFPIIQFHSRWDSLKSWIMGVPLKDRKGSLFADYFVQDMVDITDRYSPLEDRGQVPEETLAVLTDLLDYLDREQVKALFVKVPQVVDADVQGRMNSLEDVIAQRGYPCLDLMRPAEEMGLNRNMDFYNFYHTNAHGSLKIVNAMADYLVANYGFTDKRGQPGWESWDLAASDYMKTMNRFLLPFELEPTRRFESAIPALSNLQIEGQSAGVSWAAVDAVDGYTVYRREGNGAWMSCATVDASTLSYADGGLKPSTTYTYTVVPVRDDDKSMLYGSFDINGVTGKTKKLEMTPADAGDAGGNEE